MSPALADYATAQPAWKRAEFDRVFDLPRFRGSLLLRLHSYYRGPTDGEGNEMWLREDFTP